MLKLLLRLLWLQKRRDFSWKEALVGAYILVFYFIFGFSFYLTCVKDGREIFDDGVPATLGVGIVLGVLIPDIISKLIMKRDATAMDDYLKSRPVPEKLWNRFLLLANLGSFWNYVLPVLMLPVLFWLTNVSQAFLIFLMLLAFSFIDGIYITCYRKAQEFMLKWPLVLGWLGMYMVLLGYMLLFSWMPAWMLNLGLFVWAGLVFAGLLLYLYNLKIYNENYHKALRFHTFRKTTLYSLQYVGLMRAKRVRNMVLMMVVMFFFDSLLMLCTPMLDGGEVSRGNLIMYVVGDVLLPSVVLSQWTFGIEANFFQGLMTKPVRVAQLLRNCYYFYLSISGVMAILALSFLFITDGISVFSIVGAFAMAVTINLTNLPTCLFSTRLEIFNTSLFSMQGANTKINLYGILFLIPLGIMAGVYYLWGELVWCVVSVGLGIMAFACHRKVIAKLASVYERRKYQRMEKYMD